MLDLWIKRALACPVEDQTNQDNTMLLIYACIAGEVYNIGTDSERTVLQVAQDIAKRFGMDTGKIVNVRDRAFNDRCVLEGDSCMNSLSCILSQANCL